ncbi:serine/threonine protein kinase [Calothrix sp. HK-06]|nr:serine/threonine protein kinase [Calothrix sp. HK-06]
MAGANIYLPGYQIGERIYAGSRTLVCRAIRLADGKSAIVKLMRNEYPSFSELIQFRNQFIISQNLNIDGVVQPLSLETYKNFYVLVMEDFGGIPLGEYFRQFDELALSEFFDAGIQIAQALDALHKKRIIHKDIKPANILINPHTKQVKLIDFSIASLLPRETQQLKNPNVLEGTLTYISPEQTGRMNRGIDYRTDFYSLGATFYELLTQQIPFTTTDPMELIHCHIAKLPPTVTSINLKIPQQLSDIVAKLMAKNAEERYQSALGLKYDLEFCQQSWNSHGSIPSFELGQYDLCDRFIIPEKLYGREVEINQLLSAFERISNGSSEVMLLAGFSGIGKTAVVNEVHKPIVRQRGYFIRGKYDQFQRHIPFSSFVQAFRDLMGQLLSESNTSLEYWKKNILQVLGENAQVIVDVIPELEAIIGKQPQAVELEGSAVQNRFNLLFQNFIKIFATSEHPLVIFLDDLQWADSASLKLMQLLAAQSNTEYMLIIGAYRDNEVSAAHPLMLTLAQIRSLGATVNQIAIAPLELTNINDLVADTLNCSRQLALPLAELVYQKTKGNPFFCTQFIKVLYEEKLITFNFESRYWECNISTVREQALTDDVLELMAQVLKKLPISTQIVLQFAACIGNEFDLNSLAIVSEKLHLQTATDLWQALQEELIIPKNETYKFFHSNTSTLESGKSVIDSTQINIKYKFLHDRVQQAAYALIPEAEKQAIHFKIGKLLLKNISDSEREEKIFDIVNHLNTGISFIQEPERQEIIELNLFAAKKAKAATAYLAAQEYINMSLGLLPVDCWESQYDLAFLLYREKIEIEYLNGNFDISENLIFKLLPRLKFNYEKGDILNILIVQHTLNYKYIEGIKVGRDALKLLDIDLPEDNFYEELQAEYNEVNRLLAQRNITSLIDLPLMESQDKIVAARLLMNLDAIAYIGMPQLFPIVALKLVKLSLQHGNTPESARGFSDYGVLLGAIFQDYKSGYEFGMLAINLSDFFNTPALKCRTYFMFASFINHWYKHIRFSNSINDDAYRFGLESGEFQNSGYSLWGKTLNLFCQGANLTDILANFSGFIDFSEKTHNVSTTDALVSIELVARNLSGLTANSDDFSSDNSSEIEYTNRCESRKSFLGLCSYKIMKSQVLYMYGDWDRSYQYAIEAKETIQYVMGFFCIAVHNFYYSLALVRKYEMESDNDAKTEYYQQIQQNQTQMKTWADSCPENFLHKYLLVQAEMLRVAGDNFKAMEMYDRAINLAKENQYLQEEALACELAAKFYLSWDKPKIAQVYLTDSYYAYARWGAKVKIHHLEQHYPQLLTLILEPQTIEVKTSETIILNATQTKTNSSASVASVFDLASIIKASQAISSEIEIERLLAVLMQLVLENAGASKSVLVLLKNEQMFVEASATITLNEEITTNIYSLPVEKSDLIPLSVLNYVKNSAKFLLVNDISRHVNWFSDAYIQSEQPKSVLCLPINRQGELIGLLYLENKSVVGAFTSDRIELLQLICSQAAISIENAQLYERSQLYAKQIESSLFDLQVTKQQLETSFAELKQMQLQLVQSEKMSALGGLVAGIAHEINNPIGCITGNIEPAEQYVEDLFEIINLYQHEHTQPSAKLCKKVKAADLEYIREDLPKLLISMRQSIDRIYDISVSLRTFSRSDNHKPIVCNIHECLDSTLLILRHRLKASESRPQIEVIKNYSDVPEFACYPGQLNQVFMNLLANAIDALDESNVGLSYQQIQASHNCITVATSITTDKQSVLISIRDNGLGMTEEVKAQIFEHLFTTKPVGKGTGLGLAIARQIIVDKHGGSIQVNSSPQQGAEFVIQLPFRTK